MEYTKKEKLNSLNGLIKSLNNLEDGDYYICNVFTNLHLGLTKKDIISLENEKYILYEKDFNYIKSHMRFIFPELFEMIQEVGSRNNDYFMSGDAWVIDLDENQQVDFRINELELLIDKIK